MVLSFVKAAHATAGSAHLACNLACNLATRTRFVTLRFVTLERERRQLFASMFASMVTSLHCEPTALARETTQQLIAGARRA